VPFAVRKRGGRKLVLAPDGAPVPPVAPQVDSTLVKAIARGFRWQKMLETGRYATIKEIAKAEKINPSYVSRVLRLTLLAPATVEAIFDGRASAVATLAEAILPFPVAWQEQRRWIGGAIRVACLTERGRSKPTGCIPERLVESVVAPE
jgi:hypothetical protein